MIHLPVANLQNIVRPQQLNYSMKTPEYSVIVTYHVMSELHAQSYTTSMLHL